MTTNVSKAKVRRPLKRIGKAFRHDTFGGTEVSRRVLTRIFSKTFESERMPDK